MKKEQVLISIFLIAILVMSSGIMVAFAKSNTYVVKPNGVDDTADIQAAFNACGASPGCTVQLVAGTYYVGQIAAYGFQGSFVGMGQGVTNIEALPNLPSPNPADNTNTVPFWAALPTPASVPKGITPNPWPALFTFVNGAFVISGMTINEPYTATTCTAATPCPTLGWDDVVQGNGIETALLAPIVITGETQSVSIDHVTVTAASMTNMVVAIFDAGMLLPEGWTNALSDQIPLSGTFSLTNSEITENNPEIANVVNAVITVSHTTVEDNYAAVYVRDLSNSKITITGNLGIDLPAWAAVVAGQSIDKPACTATITSDCLLPSTLYVTDNDFQVNDGGNAVLLQDFGTPSTLNVVVSGNTFQTDTSCGCYIGADPADYSAIVSQNLESVSVTQNTILGGGSAGVAVFGGPGMVSGNTITKSYVGVWLNDSTGVQVTGNLVKNSAEYGIAVTDDSSYNTIARNIVYSSGAYDIYWDQTGTGNVWCGNLYRTSSPSVLPSC